MSETNDKTSLALIGCGSLGAQHAANIENIEGADLIAVSSRSLDSAETLSDSLSSKPKPYSDHKQMLEEQELDAVLIITPNHTHHQIVLDAAEAGAHIFCEKPMALTVSDCDDMIAAAEKAPVHIMIGYVRRFKNAYKEMKQLVHAGKIGTPISALAMVPRSAPPATGKDWVHSRKMYGGLFSLYSHELDQLNWILGEVESVEASMEFSNQSDDAVEDSILLNLDFISGLKGTLQCGLDINEYELRIQGETGSLHLSADAQLWFTTTNGDPDQISVKDNNAMADEIKYFVKCIQEGSQPNPTGVDGRRTIVIAEAAYESAKTGRKTYLPQRRRDAEV